MAGCDTWEPRTAVRSDWEAEQFLCGFTWMCLPLSWAEQLYFAAVGPAGARQSWQTKGPPLPALINVMADELPLTELFHGLSYSLSAEWLRMFGGNHGVIGKKLMQNLPRKQQEINLFMSYTCRTRGIVWMWIWILACELFPPTSPGRE